MDDDRPISTRDQAHAQAMEKAPARYAQILAYLERNTDGTLWEIAQYLHVGDNVISGRISELLDQGQIEPTGATRTRPGARCPSRVYRIKQPLLWVDSLFPNVS